MKTIFSILLVFTTLSLSAQLSPGDLSKPHSHLEGISNCTQCHVLGNKITDEKCLKCHTEIQVRITAGKGYHSSTDVKGKQCISCHSEHNGKDFQLIRLDTAKFNHSLTGYQLSTPHARKACNDCHVSKNISDQKLRNKKTTFLGVGTSCLTCHYDNHKGTLSQDCLSCHTAEAFKPAAKFNHQNTRFRLEGKHKEVTCIKCHKTEVIEGKKFQEFRGVKYNNCNSCHKDPHQNKFGQNCSQCHSEESFLVVKGGEKFDHNKTDFKLEGKHQSVNCKACHKTNFTDPLKFTRCTDCHTDYHKKQFAVNGVSPDCSKCHNVNGFTSFSYTIEQHNISTFPLKGGHAATPCFECHRKQKEWSFRNIGIKCADCHKDQHKGFIREEFYPGSECRICHNEGRWNDVTFNHSKTAFILTGAHLKQSCSVCHYKKDPNGIPLQKFSGLPKNCSDCHADKHFGQFEKNGVTDCTSCHGTEDWKASKFNHNNTNFKLDGKHIGVPCAKCHKPEQSPSGYFVKYKLKEYKCESCHF